MTEKLDNKHGSQLVNQLLLLINDTVTKGFGPLVSSKVLAEEYVNNKRYKSNNNRVDGLIRKEALKSFGTGFLTGLGGFITMPITLPTGVMAALIVQARMVGAIAEIYGHSCESSEVKTAILLCLTGDKLVDIIKSTGIEMGNKLTISLIKKIPGKILTAINKKVGFRLLTKAGQKGVVNLSKLAPLAGGPISGAFDSASCYMVGKAAKKYFHEED